MTKQATIPLELADRGFRIRDMESGDRGWIGYDYFSVEENLNLWLDPKATVSRAKNSYRNILIEKVDDGVKVWRVIFPPDRKFTVQPKIRKGFLKVFWEEGPVPEEEEGEEL